MRVTPHQPYYAHAMHCSELSGLSLFPLALAPASWTSLTSATSTAQLRRSPAARRAVLRTRRARGAIPATRRHLRFQRGSRVQAVRPSACGSRPSPTTAGSPHPIPPASPTGSKGRFSTLGDINEHEAVAAVAEDIKLTRAELAAAFGSMPAGKAIAMVSLTGASGKHT
jgi:hypothetical protein